MISPETRKFSLADCTDEIRVAAEPFVLAGYEIGCDDFMRGFVAFQPQEFFVKMKAIIILEKWMNKGIDRQLMGEFIKTMDLPIRAFVLFNDPDIEFMKQFGFKTLITSHGHVVMEYATDGPFSELDG